MVLSDVAPGGSAVICTLPETGGVFLRLREMGVLPGTPIRLLRAAPGGDPLEIQIRGYNLSIRLAEAAEIEVEIQAAQPR